MNLLAINFSPREKGHTYSYICKIIEKIKPDFFEIINFPKLNIGYCSGCLECEATGNCTNQDDWQVITKKLEKADVVILGSPIYAWQLAAPAHVFTNRCRMYISYSEGMGFKKMPFDIANKKYYQINPRASHPPPFKIRIKKQRDCYIIITQALHDPRRFLSALKIFSEFVEKILLFNIRREYIIASSGAPHGGEIFELKNYKKIIKLNELIT